MKRLATGAAAAALFLGAGSQTATAAPVSVTIQYQAFAPFVIDALPGDVVTWSNTSDQTHTVTSDTGQFDSGYLSSGNTFSYSFASTGTYAYHCILHRGMVGEIDVRQVTLDPLPPSAVLANSTVKFSGRTADPGTPVELQMRTAQGFQTVAKIPPAADGSWSTSVVAHNTASFRAVSGTGTSETRRLLVINRTVRIRATRAGVAVTVTPSSPYKLVALQYRLRDRFGWWIVQRQRLDYVSATAFRVHPRGRVLARVVLLGPDHWTPVAISRAVPLHRH